MRKLTNLRRSHKGTTKSKVLSQFSLDFKLYRDLKNGFKSLLEWHVAAETFLCCSAFFSSSLWTQFKKSNLERREKSNKSSLDWKRFSPPLEGLCKAEKHTNKIKWDEKYLICKFFYFNFRDGINQNWFESVEHVCWCFSWDDITLTSNAF